MGRGASAALGFHLAGPALATMNMRLLHATIPKLGVIGDLHSPTMKMRLLDATNSKTGCHLGYAFPNHENEISGRHKFENWLSLGSTFPSHENETTGCQFSSLQQSHTGCQILGAHGNAATVVRQSSTVSEHVYDVPFTSSLQDAQGLGTDAILWDLSRSGNIVCMSIGSGIFFLLVCEIGMAFVFKISCNVSATNRVKAGLEVNNSGALADCHSRISLRTGPCPIHLAPTLQRASRSCTGTTLSLLLCLLYPHSKLTATVLLRRAWKLCHSSLLLWRDQGQSIVMLL